MLYSEDSPGGNRFALVITGDGKTERRILRAMSEKFDGRSLTLYFPAPPMSGGRTGLMNLLKGLRVEMSNRELHALLLIDREYVDMTGISRACSEFGITVDVIEQQDSFMEANFAAGAQRAHVYLAVSGLRQNIEEDLAALINRHLHVDVSPTKDAIRRCLREAGLKTDELITNAALPDISASFSGLSAALVNIERNLGQH